jgi:hypothetical protein
MKNIRNPFSRRCLALGLALGLGGGATLTHAELLNLTPSDPVIEYGGAGIISYVAATGLVTISGIPALLSQADPFIYGDILGTGADDERLITVQFHVDAAGNVLSGIDGPDLVVKGSVDIDFDGVPDYDGVLLEAEVSQFGFADGPAGGNDSFDVRLTAVGGLLAPLYGANDLALAVESEVSSEFPEPFAGSFAADFVGQAKGRVGSTAPLPPAQVACAIDVNATCSVEGGPDKSKCRIKVSKSPKHWEHVDYEYHGRVCRKSKYGMHGHTVPSWANRYPTTDVTFSYVVTNTGTTPISDLLVTDSFDTPLSGVPATLAPGQSVILSRTEQLSEGIDDTVTVMGQYQTAVCTDNDVVVIKQKLRERQRHDDDRYRDKGKGEH